MKTKITNEELKFLLQANKEAAESCWIKRAEDRRKLFMRIEPERRIRERRDA